MKKLTHTLLLLLASATVFSFTMINSPSPYETVTSARKVNKIKEKISKPAPQEKGKRELRRVDNFTSISTAIECKIFYEQADECRIEIEADENVWLNIITEVIDGELVIRFKNNKDRKGDISFYIFSKDITNVELSGNVDFVANGKVKTENLNISMSGSGDIKFVELSAESVTTNIAGSGDIILEGKDKGDNLLVNIAGSGDTVAKKFKVKSANINIAGSGDCNVDASENLEVNIVGSGDVIYQGTPKVKTNIIGSGEVKRD